MAYDSAVGQSDSTVALDDGVNSGSAAGSPALTVGERAAIVEMLTADMGLTRAQAHKFIDAIDPAQARTFLSLMNGSDSITRDEAIQVWGLTPEEANALFPEGKVLSTFTNPFGRAFTMFLMLTYSLEIDLKQILSEVLQVQKDEAIAKAEDIFKGAIIQFACAMTAAVVTGVFAGKSAYAACKTAKTPAPDPKNPDQTAAQTKAATDNMWFGPIGASLINQPITAGGEFGNAWYQREGMYHDANVEEARSIYQQLMSIYDSTGQLSRTASQGL